MAVVLVVVGMMMMVALLAELLAAEWERKRFPRPALALAPPRPW